jgi:hypothetical protein
LIIKPEIAQSLLAFNFPLIDTGIDTIAEMSLAITGGLYIIASLLNLYIPDTGVDHKPIKNNPVYLVHEFFHCFMLLWHDRLGRISLAVTTLFWGAGATLQFLVLDWAKFALNIDLSAATLLQGIVAVGVAIGAFLAAKVITLRKSVRVIPMGIAMGTIVMSMIFVHNTVLASVLLLIIGALSGFFVVPMNALLQHRGHILMGAGHSIAVQNFNENLSILVMTSLYSVLIGIQLPINWVIAIFGFFVISTMWLVMRHHNTIQRGQDDIAHLDDGAL